MTAAPLSSRSGEFADLLTAVEVEALVDGRGLSLPRWSHHLDESGLNINGALNNDCKAALMWSSWTWSRRGDRED